MFNLARIAIRNLRRYRRRTGLTVSLIAFGVVFVLVFVAVSSSFKDLMVRQITDSYLGDLQIHRRGYVASIETLPLNLNLNVQQAARVAQVLEAHPQIVAYSERIKFGAMFSNFTETTNIRINGVVPEKEFATCPQMSARIADGDKTPKALARGKMLVPVLLARGMGIKVGDTVVVVATNKDGSVNGKTLMVSGILESATGPGGRDGYIHIEDAMEILRMPQREISEFAINARRPDAIERLAASLTAQFQAAAADPRKSPIQVHTWAELSPFANIARMIDVMTFFIKLMLIAIVLISVLNVMIMAVYERVREIGTIAAIGTLSGKILSLFLLEGLFLGVAGTVAGLIGGLAIIFGLNLWKISFNFGQATGLILAPTIDPAEILVACALVVSVSIVASWQPARKASLMEPIEALRHV
ncbi:MAG TPA: ABC transporter permease [Candidatus Binatia bacterium]|nr:ABC transporter permease [Candidatus Binatia bacterium]